MRRSRKWRSPRGFEAPAEPAEAAEPEKAPDAPVEPPEEAVPEKAPELYEMPMGGKMLRFYFLRTELSRGITHAVVKLHGAEDHALFETRPDDFKMFPGKGEQGGLCYIHNVFFEREAQKVDAQILEPEKVEPAQVEPVEPVQRRSAQAYSLAAKESDRTVLFQQIRRGLSLGRPAPDLLVKLINPERDEELVGVWCKAGGRFPNVCVDDKKGEFNLYSEFVHAYCWELSWDSVAGQRHAEQAEPADAKPAVAEDKPAEADDKPAELQAQEPAEQAEDVEPADAEDAKPAELHQEPAEQAEPAEAKPAEEGEDAKPAEVEPAAEADAKPAEEEAEDDQPADDKPADDFETLRGLRMRRVEGDWYELAARTLDEFEVAEKILRSRLKDKTFAEFKMKRGDKGWTYELFEVNWTTGKLWLPKGRRSVLAEEAKARVRLSA